MGKLFLHGRNEEVNITKPYAKLTVNCPKNIILRAESADSLTKLDADSGNSGKVVFDKLEQGKWNVTFLNVQYPPTQQVDITNINFEMTLEPVAARSYSMRRSAPVDEARVVDIAESFEATIRVTYPEGSVCVCSGMNTVMHAADTSGYYDFVVPCFGDWTIACTDGKYRRSAIVTVTDDGQIENISLDYTTYLYNAGVECAAWNTRNNDGSVSKEYDSIIFNASTTSTSQFGPSVITATKQDLTGVDTIFVDCVYTGASKYNFTVYIRDNNDVVDNIEEDCLAYAQLNNMYGTLELDVSNFSGRYFIEIFYSSDGPSTGVIDSVYYL